MKQIISKELKNAQSSFEMLLIVGVALTFVAMIAGFYITFSSESREALDEQQLEKVFSDVVSKASRVYFQGNGNRLTIDSTLPEGILNISLHQRNNGSVDYTYLNVTTTDGRQLVYIPDELLVTLNCSSSCFGVGYPKYYEYRATTSGPKRIRVESKEDFVLIDFVS